MSVVSFFMGDLLGAMAPAGATDRDAYRPTCRSLGM